MDKTMYNEEMKHLLKFQDAHAPRLFFGLEEDIRLAVLKDEIDHLKLKTYEEDSSVNVLNATIATLEARIKEYAQI